MKNKGGRPLLYETVEKLQKIIDEYFDWCDNRTRKIYDDKTGKEILIIHPAPYTMSGLARRLGMSRQTLINYEKRDKFFDTIKKARDRVHENVETLLLEGRNQTGAIFNLKNNFDWIDEKRHTYQGRLDVIVGKLETTVDKMLVDEDKKQKQITASN